MHDIVHRAGRGALYRQTFDLTEDPSTCVVVPEPVKYVCTRWARAQYPGREKLFGSALWVMTVQQHGKTRPCNTRYEVTPAKNR